LLPKTKDRLFNVHNRETNETDGKKVWKKNEKDLKKERVRNKFECVVNC